MIRKILLFSICVFLFLFPHIFWGPQQYSVGGDDSMLYYIFPAQMIWNYAVNIISDNLLSVVGTYGVQLQNVPLFFFSLIFKELLSGLNTQLVFFGLNLSIGFLGFYFFLGELIYGNKLSHFASRILASLFYIFSTFSIYTLWLAKLTSVYLIALAPLSLYLFLYALRRDKYVITILNGILLAAFSSSLLSVPWIIALLISLTPFLLFNVYKYRAKFFAHLILLVIIVCLLNFYWLFHFFYAPFSSDVASANIITQTIRPKFIESNETTIKGVTTGNTLIFPLVGLFHNTLQKHFDWKSYAIYKNWHLPLLTLNFAFLAIILIPGTLLKPSGREKKLYFVAILGLLIATFLFTVKIGGGGDKLFLWFNSNIPGFTMFRNMYDKFGLAMAFTYSMLFAISLKIILDSTKQNSVKAIFATFILVLIAANAKPFILGEYYKLPMWSTKNTYNRISDFNPDFYSLIHFLKEHNNPSRYIWVPISNVNYIQIQDTHKSNHYYSGVSPLLFLSKTNDVSGKLSIPDPIGERLIKNILNGRTQEVLIDFQKLNINYVIVNNDISKELQNSYLFGKELYNSQQKHFRKAVLGRKLASFGSRYELFELNPKYQSQKIYLTNNYKQIPENFKNVSFRKLESYKYEVTVRNLSVNSKLVFLEPFHKQWKLFTKSGESLPLNSHDIVFDYANGWTPHIKEIKNKIDPKDYSENKDGSINIVLTLYFVPQRYVNHAIAVSVVAFAGCVIYLTSYLIRKYQYEKKE